MPDITTKRRLSARMLLIAALCLCLCITTYAVIYGRVDIEDNTFQTGKVDIEISPANLTDDEIFKRFEPGMTVTKDFTVKNSSTASVYYKVYLTDVSGELADVLDVRILDSDNNSAVLASGKAGALGRSDVSAFGELAENAKRNLTIEFHYPEQAGNAGQAKELSFKLAAEATQTKNNPDKEF